MKIASRYAPPHATQNKIAIRAMTHLPHTVCRLSRIAYNTTSVPTTSNGHYVFRKSVSFETQTAYENLAISRDGYSDKRFFWKMANFKLNGELKKIRRIEKIRRIKKNPANSQKIPKTGNSEEFKIFYNSVLKRDQIAANTAHRTIIAPLSDIFGRAKTHLPREITMQTNV